MRGIISKPLGTLSRFLGLQQQGALNIGVEELLRPTFDLSDFLGPMQYQEHRAAAVAQNATTNAFTVPQGHIWRVFSFSVMVVPPAGVWTDSYLRFVRFGSVNGQVWGPPGMPIVHYFGSAADPFMHGDQQENGYTVQFNGKRFMESGDLIAVRLQRGTGAGNNEVRVSIQYQDLAV